MINTNNLSQLSYSLEDILKTKVNPKLLSKLTEYQRSQIGKAIYKWTIIKDPAISESIENWIKKQLDSVKPVKDKRFTKKLEQLNKAGLY